MDIFCIEKAVESDSRRMHGCFSSACGATAVANNSAVVGSTAGAFCCSELTEYCFKLRAHQFSKDYRAVCDCWPQLPQEDVIVLCMCSNPERRGNGYAMSIAACKQQSAQNILSYNIWGGFF
jgi:hypothetical protein